MPHAPLQARNYLLACYAISLIQGETIRGKPIRHKTICNYVNAAAKLMKEHDKVHLPDPRNAPVDYVDIVLKAVKKYEKQPNRRNMIDDEMVHYMEKTRTNHTPDSLEDAITDWVYLGRFVGYRSIEWCQTTELDYHKIEHPNWDREKSYAFIGRDFAFYNDKKQRLYNIADLSPDDVAYVVLEFRKQKNGVNGEKIPYEKDTQNPQFCPVCAALRIVQRALRLGVPAEEPVGVFAITKGKQAGHRRFITASKTATFLRQVAATVFNLRATDKELQKWSSHSIRVTAACLLHRQQMSDTYIQTRLRWRSSAFLDYLRNTLYTARTHTKALHIPANNLPLNERRYKAVTLPSGHMQLVEDPAGDIVPRRRRREEIESVLAACAPAA